MAKVPASLARLIAVPVILGAVAYVVSLSLPPIKTKSVAVPPPSASAKQVVAAYIEALNAHDCSTARELTTDPEASGVDHWCRAVAHLGDVHIGAFGPESPEEAGVPQAQTAIYDGVTFHLRWRLFHNDGSMPNGQTDWGYELKRRSTHSAWRIFAQGTG